MLTAQDIQKIKSVVATKEDLKKMQASTLKIFATKKDLRDMQARSLEVFATKKDMAEVKTEMAEMKELLQGLFVATDSIAKSIGELKMEYAAISTQLTRHDRWIKQIAEKIGINLAIE